MLKKLRIKLTFINMLLVTLVLLVVLATLLLSNYRKNVDSTRQALTIAMEEARGRHNFQDFPPPGGEAEKEDGQRPNGDYAGPSIDFREFGSPRSGNNDGLSRFLESYTPTVVVSVTEDGSYTTLLSMVASISEENLKSAVAAAMDSENAEGLLSSYSLRFMKEEGTDTLGNAITYIAFADRSHEMEQLRSLLLSSLVIGLPSLLLLLGISLLLSSLALRPVKKALDQQRQFIADASHELKTPLAVILANNDILLSHPQDTIGTQMNWVTSTKEEGDRMKKLIDNLLFLARSDADRLPLTMVSSNLSDLVMGCALTFEPVAFEQGILVDTEITPGLTATFDEAQMKQLIMILLDNACKYSVEKGTVTVTLEKVPGKGVTVRGLSGKGASGKNGADGTILLSVHNDGEPIPPESLPHLFDRFYRVDESRTTQRSGGYGLGLAIAKTIAELHHGTIEAESDAGNGTTFRVFLQS